MIQTPNTGDAEVDEVLAGESGEAGGDVEMEREKRQLIIVDKRMSVIGASLFALTSKPEGTIV